MRPRKKSRHAGAIHTASSMSGLNGINIDHLGIAVRSLDEARPSSSCSSVWDVILREMVAAERR